MASKFGYTTGKGKYFANPSIGKKYEDDNEKDMKPLSTDDDSPESTEVHIKHDGPGGTITKDGEDHEYDSLENMHKSLDKFFNEEESEWKKDPEDEEKQHKGSMGDDDDDESSPFGDISTMKSMMSK